MFAEHLNITWHTISRCTRHATRLRSQELNDCQPQYRFDDAKFTGLSGNRDAGGTGLWARQVIEEMPVLLKDWPENVWHRIARCLHTGCRGDRTTAPVAIESWLDVRNSDRISPYRCGQRASPQFLRQRLLLPKRGSGIWSLYRSSAGRRAGSRGGPRNSAWATRTLSGPPAMPVTEPILSRTASS